MEDICSPYYNPGNVVSSSTGKEVTYNGLCDGVKNGYVAWAENNDARDGSNETYSNLVNNAYQLGYTIPSSNNWGCLPGAGTVFQGELDNVDGLQAACAALG